MLLTEHDWEQWFEVTPAESARLVAVQAALMEAGFCPCPETVIGMSRSLLGESMVATKLRRLADRWERSPAGGVEVEPAWPELAEPNFVSALRSYRWLGGDSGEGSHSGRCRRRHR